MTLTKKEKGETGFKQQPLSLSNAEMPRLLIHLQLCPT
jgi:hypothetical protein